MDMRPTDERYMQRALDLAILGLGSARPNPVVGSVIVHDDRIIGEGWHQSYGGPHAEVHAVASVADHALLPHSTVYVTLEPCAHYGKTPPCADLLIEKKVGRVVVCNEDPNPLVDGGGIARIRAAGIPVTVGVLAEKGEWINRRFFTFMRKKRPYLVLKWAQTTDRFTAREDYSSKWISNSLSRKIVHKYRAEEQAIMIGSKTAAYDNPRLDIRDWTMISSNPVRIVIDRQNRLRSSHPGLHLFDGNAPTILYHCGEPAPQAETYTEVALPARDFIQEMMTDLHQRNIQSILVEGGSTLHQLLLQENLWDEMRVFTGRQSFGKGVAAAPVKGTVAGIQHLDGDQLTIYINDKTVPA
ncbi:bifunctional diaminohydroxyphosphoribosylaminopyrimidine deaminase/5-amino-6-(5-phosphoribosylamino)uracil reductase RibD [Roseivirga sp. BDSF3-8]|uniref:bifunctional diaminohydroxyphosphoribosylaminopyrimidine deaminase/5-amino-6-(5-phosphoribosylamino)uracil reductase RibD n=1 Tax=Roseivirga sp. BDSF3-8 TaxID=3241598 RepID=UPI00353262A6